jgi:hypothetical protein
VVRQRSAKPLFIGSIPIAASKQPQKQQAVESQRPGLTDPDVLFVESVKEMPKGSIFFCFFQAYLE